jgi:TolB protein
VAAGHAVFDAIVASENLREFDVSHGTSTSGTLLLQGTSVDRQPVYSPDGNWIAFSSNRSGNLDIWARSTHTQELRRLTDDPADDWDPAFTRDGKQLIWTSRRGGNFEIWMANADGTGARQITHDGVDAENATATPDGQWLVYNSANPANTGLWKIRTDGSQASQLVRGTCAWPEVSPDGRYVSYARLTGAALAEVRVVRVEDGQEMPIDIRIEAASTPNGRNRWLPDGSAIAFNWQKPGAPGIYVQDFRPGSDTSASRRTLVQLDPQTSAESFGISPDGSRLTLAGTYRTFNLMTADGVADLIPPRRAAR